jgi:hypothetical protein
MKGVGDREILETYLNSASKYTSETDIFPNGTKSLLTSIIGLDSLDVTEVFVLSEEAHFRKKYAYGGVEI